MRAQSSTPNGCSARFGETMAHCVAAEPHATFLRVSVSDGGEEVAYETAVLGRLREGYRVFRLRDPSLGTRISLCYLLVHIRFSEVPHQWATARELRRRFADRLTKELSAP